MIHREFFGQSLKIKQWDFVKACMVLAGAVPVIQNGALLLMGYDEAMGVFQFESSRRILKEVNDFLTK